MVLLAVAVFLIYMLLAPLLLARWIMEHLGWLLLVIGMLAFIAVWFWIVASYGFEGNGGGELFKIMKEAIG